MSDTSPRFCASVLFMVALALVLSDSTAIKVQYTVAVRGVLSCNSEPAAGQRVFLKEEDLISKSPCLRRA